MRFIIEGPTTIHGSIFVSGAKNAALPLLAASLIVDEPLTIRRLPLIEDVARMIEIIERIGAHATRSSEDGTACIDGSSLTTSELPVDLTGKLRACTILLGPLLARFGSAVLPQPGGCTIGRRPIDLFIDGFRSFGVTVTEENEVTRFSGTAHATRYVFPMVSVTGTEALLLLAVRTPGISILENIALEPEVTELANFLIASGAGITGIGTTTLKINGADRLSGGSVTCIPDRIEAGTFAALTAACGGDLEITNCIPEHLAVPLKLLTMMGAVVDVGADRVHITVREPLRAMTIRTHEYPGLPTDLQPPFTVALTQAHGLTLVHEAVYEGRLFYVDKLNKMGANVILCDPHRCIIEGPRQLHGTTLESPDIRAGIALIIAAACAHGTSSIDNIYQIDRGFERIEERLQSIGVRIRREA